MKIYIRSPEGFDPVGIKQTLMFYLSRFQFAVDSLKFEVKHLQPIGGVPSYRIHLDSRLIGGQSIWFEETQTDARLAMQRLMDRLERHLNRRKSANDYGYLNRGTR